MTGNAVVNGTPPKPRKQKSRILPLLTLGLTLLIGRALLLCWTAPAFRPALDDPQAALPRFNASWLGQPLSSQDRDRAASFRSTPVQPGLYQNSVTVPTATGGTAAMQRFLWISQGKFALTTITIRGGSSASSSARGQFIQSGPLLTLTPDENTVRAGVWRRPVHLRETTARPTTSEETVQPDPSQHPLILEDALGVSIWTGPLPLPDHVTTADLH